MVLYPPAQRDRRFPGIFVFSNSRKVFWFPPILSSMPAMIKVNSYRLPALFFFHFRSLPHEANDSSMLSVAEVRPLSKGMVNFRDNEKGTFATCYSWSGHNVIPPERRNRCQHTPVRERGLHSQRNVVHRLFRKDDPKSPSCPVMTIRPCYLTMPTA